MAAQATTKAADALYREIAHIGARFMKAPFERDPHGAERNVTTDLDKGPQLDRKKDTKPEASGTQEQCCEPQTYVTGEQQYQDRNDTKANQHIHSEEANDVPSPEAREPNGSGDPCEPIRFVYRIPFKVERKT